MCSAVGRKQTKEKTMPREIVAPRSSINDAFIKLFQQNPDAMVTELITVFRKMEGEGALEKITVTAQDLKSMKDPDFDDPAIKKVLAEMITKITAYLGDARDRIKDGESWSGKTKDEIKSGVRPDDNLENYAFNEAMKLLLDGEKIRHVGGDRRGSRYELA